MNLERIPYSKKPIEIVRDYVVEASKRGFIKGFCLEGREKNNVQNDSYAQIFIGPKTLMGRRVSILSGERKEKDIYEKILNLQLTPQAKKYQPLIESKDGKIRSESMSLAYDIPYGVIAFGKDRETQEEVVTLYVTVDQTPKKVLREMKSKIFEKNLPLTRLFGAEVASDPSQLTEQVII